MSDAANQAQLSIPEGVLLCHAMVARVAETRGVRAFFIKGPASVVQGLRPPKTSTDVDVFVAPSSLEHILQGLKERGWRERPAAWDIGIFQKHSITVEHPEWPCCIDVHYRFPGMEHPPSHAFEVMWANTERLKLAGPRLRVPSIALGALILALHALRSPHLPACRQELEFLARLTALESLEPAVLEIAKATGSLAAARPFLEDLLPETIEVEWPEPSAEWSHRLMTKEPGTAWLVVIGQAPWRHKPKLLFSAVFPRQEVLQRGNIHVSMSLRERLLQHKARWSRFLRSAPRIVHDLKGAQSCGG